MNKLVLADEIYTFRKRYESFTHRYMHPPKFRGISKRGRFLYKHFYIITDGNPMGKYMAACLDTLVQRGTIQSVTCLPVNQADTTYDCYEYAAIAFDTFDSLNAAVPKDECAFLFFADCNRVEEREAWLAAIEKVTAYAAQGRRNMCVLSAMLPEYPAIPQGITSLAEREFSYFLEKTVAQPTPEQAFYIELEGLCRKIVSAGFEKLNIARVDNLFGPDANHIRTFDLDEFIDRTFEEKRVVVAQSDYEQVLSCSYIQNALAFATQLLYTARCGQVYNFCSHTVSIAQLKTTIHSQFKEQLALEVKSDAVTDVQYRCLNTLKFFQCQWTKKSVRPLADVLYQTVCNRTGQPHNNEKNIKIYAGKLDRIKELELMMLRDIDEICRRHDIKYFLCGGTMLGAVRYGHSIPWDDDLDIGMLREDFNKFRKVCQEENKPIYNYSSHINKSGSHYIVDKVRLNGTYFSTRYSSIHEYPDGLFIDVLVYDQTTNNRFLGNLQGKILHCMSKAIQIRWYNRPRKKYHFLASVVLLPIMRLFPMGFYHKLFEFTMQMFKNTRNSKYVVDSTGKLQKKGPFLKKGLEDVQYVEFDGGFQAPIPADYTDYLTFDYGPDYLPEPVLSQRKAPHNFARIDLGEYIFETKEQPDFRDVNVHGELFEQEQV